MNKIISIILAAGEGTRMKSKNSKVIHKIAGKALIEWVVNTAKQAGIEKNIVVVGHRKDQVKSLLGDSVFYVNQEEKLGTGHAVLQAKNHIEGFEGYVAILAGDVPMVTEETIKDAIEYMDKCNFSAVIITADAEDPTGYGRIVRNEKNNVEKIVEQIDATEDELKITEINSGMYIFKSKKLLESLEKIDNKNKKCEYYLTDTIEILKNNGEKIGASKVKNFNEILGINNKLQLYEADKLVRSKINKKHMENGVIIMDPDNTYIDADVKIGMDTSIYPNTFLEGNTIIGEDSEIGPGTKILSSKIGNNTKIINTVVLESEIGSDTKIGPYAYIRPESIIGNNIKIGDFVEIKKSIIKDKTSISHLTYIGDAEVGRNVNIGCGVVFVNYDGQKKQKTIIGDNAFIGCNTNLVAPVKIGDNAYTGAGSTITKDVPEYSLGIARAKQMNLIDWVKRTNRERKEKGK